MADCKAVSGSVSSQGAASALPPRQAHSLVIIKKYVIIHLAQLALSLRRKEAASGVFIFGDVEEVRFSSWLNKITD